MITIRPNRHLAATIGLIAALCGAPAAQAQLYETRTLYANSHCRHPMRILVHHKDSVHPHHVHGWYEFRPHQESRLEDNKIVLRHIVGEPLFVYAETIGGSGVPHLVWGGSDGSAEHGGVRYGLRRMSLSVNSRGELEFGFRCD